MAVVSPAAAVGARAARLLFGVAMWSAAAVLSGCGGGGGGSSTGPYSVSVAVSGLSGTVVVALGSSTLTFTADGSHTFSPALDSGASYDVTVQTQPPGQYCAVSDGNGTIGADVTVTVRCNDSVGGIWAQTNGNDYYLAMADETGNFWLLDYNGSSDYEYLYVGSMTVQNTTVSGSESGLSLVGTFSDGSTYGTGSLTGTINPRNALDFTNYFSPTMNTTFMTPVSLTYYPLYAAGSSLTTVAGNYTEQLNENGSTVSVAYTISGSGVIYAQDPSSGCVRNGTVALIDSNYNMYHLQYTYGDCTGNYAALNGLTFNGIAALWPATSSSPAEFVGAATAPSGTDTYYVYFVEKSN